VSRDVQVRLTACGDHLLSECTVCGPVGVTQFDHTAPAAAAVVEAHISSVHRPTGARL